MTEPLAARRLGVYYTPDLLAQTLTQWALADGATSVLDPSCGDGQFLRAVAAELHGTVGSRVVGIDVDRDAVQAFRREQRPGTQLHVRDFFEVPAFACPDAPFAAVLGNPPYVRHHWQDACVRERARTRVAEAGASLSGQADLWAYFTVHATQHIALDGRLAFVLPLAATQAHYAEDVWSFVKRNFGRVQLIVLQDRSFGQAREQPVVLLASHRGGSTRALRTSVALTIPDLASQVGLAGPDQELDGDSPDGVAQWKWQMLSRPVRVLWKELYSAPDVQPLGRRADVRIGTVTGANGLFVRRVGDPILNQFGVEARPIVSSSRLLTQVIWCNDDDDAAGDLRGGGRLLVIDPGCQPVDLLRRVLDEAEGKDVDERHHCAERDPWWALRDLGVPDAFLGYMGTAPHRLVLNTSGALCTNAIHRISWQGRGSLRGAVVSSCSSLFRLSAELYGRHYGGGVLKLEPSAAKRLPVVPNATLADVLAEIDASLRRSQHRATLRLADQRVAAALGASPSDLELLAEAAETLAAARRIPRD